jgi:RNA polymerase sigma-70 factor (ECF subfamily)
MGRRDHTDMGGPGCAFLTTQWSLIEELQAGTDEDSMLIDSLLRRYWKPVYYYLRRRGCDNEQAKDLTQGFFHEIVLGRDLLERADREKGRFRSFLLHALDHYLINERKRAGTRRRYPRGGWVALDETGLVALPGMMSSLTPEDCYNYAWLCDLLEKVLAEVEADCRSDGLDLHWTVFRERVVRPILEDSAPPSARELCERLGIDGEKRVANMLITVKRRFQAAIRGHVRNTVAREEQIDDEVQELLGYVP